MARINWKSKVDSDIEKVQVETLRTNKKTIEERAELALAKNRTFLEIVTPTNAQILAEVKALARQNNLIIRLLLNQIDGTD